MNGSRHFPRLLQDGFWPRLRRTYAGLRRDLHMDFWFPHLILALAVALFGLFKIAPEVPGALGMHLWSSQAALSNAAHAPSAVRGTPAIVVGLFLVIMAIGMLLRSKLAWAIVILVMAANLLLGIVNPTATSTSLQVFNVLLLIAMLVSYRSFRRSSLAAGTLFAITSLVLILAYAVFGSFELGAEFKPPITDLATALYFAVVTMTTVGYGDITPQTVDAKLFVVSFIVLAVAIFAVSLGAILVPVINGRLASLLKPGAKKMQRNNHFVIVGNTRLGANTCKELQARHEAVTFIYEESDGAPTDESQDVVMGSPTDLEVLRTAGAARARAVLALTRDDNKNAFVVLAMRELAADVKTVVAVRDPRNLTSVQRVHPDLIFSPQILGGELLAMALSGEQIQPETLLNQLLQFRV
ncbi:MAG: NAD-binding protein [Gammaproteobacteria bacterium]